jgi:ABC-2 type transport system ATP-binding protein
MTVRAFLEFIAAVRGYKGAAKRERVAKAVAQLELEPVLGQSIETLSKGFKRRVGLAQAILHDPRVLILDEPTDGLDPNQKHQVRKLIQSLAHDKIVIISTHILEEVSAVCTRAVVIAQGRLLADGTPLELESRSRYHQAVTLVAEEPLDQAALASLPGVAGVEQNEREHGLSVLAKPGEVILPQVNALIAERGWKVKELNVERGRLDEVFRSLTRGEVV